VVEARGGGRSIAEVITVIVLVGYATEHGSTRGIAERIAARLGEQGHQVETLPLDAPVVVGRYDAAVLGSAIHSGGWLPAATAFVECHTEALAGRPAWLFSVSTVGEQSSAFPLAVARRMRAMSKEPKGVADILKALRVRGHHSFAGVIARDHWPLAGHLFLKGLGGRYGDHRNWAEIDAWAEDIARQLAAAADAGHGGGARQRNAGA
jgi:menaquinone-dependent protoporphyrinogen oxidase